MNLIISIILLLVFRLGGFKFLLQVSPMQDKQKSGQRIKNRIRKSSNHDELNGSSTRHSLGLLDSKKSEEEIESMANQTYERVFKTKITKQNIDAQHFLEYLENKTDPDRLDHSISALIDIRDKRVKIPFESKIYADYELRKNKFNCELFLEEIRDWLVDVIEIITSIAFNYFKRDDLNLSEVKNYTAKNILLNVKDLFERYQKLSLDNRVEIMKFVNLESLKIFDHIMNKYPQNSGNRASKRVKSHIPKIDNRESDQFDFLRNNGISITYRQSGDYSEDIMKVINKLISFSTETFDPRDEYQDSNFQVFTEIMEYIFQNSDTQPIFTTVDDIAAIISEKTGLTENLQALKKMVGLTFHLGDEMASKQYSKTQRKEHVNIRQPIPKNYAVCHKIPAGTRQFTEEQIEGCQFKSHDASILRILTKWVEQLYNKLANAEEAIYTRLYKFKDNKGKLINLNIDLRLQLYQAAREELKTAKEYIKYLRKQNVYLQTIFAEERNLGKYSKLDTKIGIFAAKINEIGSQYIFKHLNKLIHCLLSIPRTASIKRNNQAEKLLLSSVNLVTLKIGDLLRCKHSCTEHQFVRIIDILQETHQKNPEILKVIRFKNRLDKNHNDVLINLFFMNKVECQLQLSLCGNVNKTEKKYGDFCHLIYEITRARLGPISQMSSIIINHDPLAKIYAKQKSYGPQLKEQYITEKKKKTLYSKIKEEISLKAKLNIGNMIDLPFVCRSCRSLAVLNNPEFLYRDRKDVEIDCNQCRFEDLQLQRPTEAYQYIVNQTFKAKGRQTVEFIMNHMAYWNAEKLINSLSTNTLSSHRSFETIPSFGLLMINNQKKPKLHLFSTAVEPAEGSFIFAHIPEDGKPRIISKLLMKHEKSKQVEAIKDELKKLMIFQFSGVFQSRQNGILNLECIKPNCCNKMYSIGAILQAEDIVSISQKSYISNLIENHKSVLRMNLIKDAFRKLEEVLNRLSRKGTLKPNFLRVVENIKAYKCNIDSIGIVDNFPNLIEINISDNPDINNLKGIQNCRYLRNLEARNCNLRNLDDIKDNIRLMYINVSRNFNLNCIRGLEDHCHIVELIISNTAVSDLSPLNTCPSIEILDIENCSEIQSINVINAGKLSYLNTYGCLKLPQDPNQSLINSLMKKSHFPHLKRSTSEIQQMTNSNIYGLPNKMTSSFQFDPLSTGLEFMYKCFTTVMHESPDPPLRKSSIYSFSGSQEERKGSLEVNKDDVRASNYFGQRIKQQEANPMTSFFKLFA